MYRDQVYILTILTALTTILLFDGSNDIGSVKAEVTIEIGEHEEASVEEKGSSKPEEAVDVKTNVNDPQLMIQLSHLRTLMTFQLSVVEQLILRQREISGPKTDQLQEQVSGRGESPQDINRFSALQTLTFLQQSLVDRITYLEQVKSGQRTDQQANPSSGGRLINQEP